MNSIKLERPACQKLNSGARIQKPESARRLVKLKFAFLQPSLVAGGVPMPMFQVLDTVFDEAGEILASAGSRMTILGLMGKGLAPVIEPARADLTEETPDKFVCALLALHDMRAEQDWDAALGLADWVTHELRKEHLAATADEAGMVRPSGGGIEGMIR